MIVPIVLPFILLAGGGLAARSLLGFFSSAVPAALAFENWKLKKLQSLGVPIEMLFPKFTEEEQAKRELLREMRRGLGDQNPILDDELNPIVIDFPHEDPRIAGRYAFISVNEQNAFLDSVRHIDLSRRTGPEFNALQGIAKGAGFDPQDLSFLWADYDPAFVRLKKLSDARLADRDFMLLANSAR